METLPWLLEKLPGEIEHKANRIMIRHHCGERSTLWVNDNVTTPEALLLLGDVYSRYNGMDLFTSTFKLFAIDGPTYSGDVPIVGSLDELKNEITGLTISFPESAVPFMYEAGIGYYAADRSRGTIYKWDACEHRLTSEYSGLDCIFEEWLKAVL